MNPLSPILPSLFLIAIVDATHKRFRDNSEAAGSGQKKRRTASPASPSSSESSTEAPASSPPPPPPPPSSSSSWEGLLSEEVRESVTIANNILNDCYIDNDRYT
jgi:hypothetical protein